ncbi:Zinc finger RING-type protein [Lasiodiplodia theobromae]|uniref:Zinc finger RING-type protein n=1 Tax=Lasiodiplodia theobromae TaxID=45133 RepID=UPI0015C38A42|nr:Zinc finger RING-type protein [Lasiodiplodia theobromae]KAF4544617.1 Zinc finger RING-type protein [Lasiodiplodia theobromae]
MFRLFGFRRSQSDNSSSETPPPQLINVQDSQPVRLPSTPPPQLVNVQDSQPVSSPPETTPPLLVRVPESPNVAALPSDDDYFANWVAQHTASGGAAAAVAALGTLAAAASDASRGQERLGGSRTNQNGDLASSQSVEQTAEGFQRITITAEQQVEAAVAAAAVASNARQHGETRPRHHYRSYQAHATALDLPFTSGAAEASRRVTREREEDLREFYRQVDDDAENARVEGGQERRQQEDSSRGGQQPPAAAAADTDYTRRPSRAAAEAGGKVRRRGRFGHVGSGNGNGIIAVVDKTELQEKGSVGCDICYERWHWATSEDVERVAPGKATMFGENEEATGEEEDEAAAVAAAAARVCQEPRKLPCGHIFGKECLTDWLARKDTCPACRRKVATGSASSPYATGLEMLRVIYNDKNKKNRDEWEGALQIFRGSPAFLDEGFTY